MTSVKPPSVPSSKHIYNNSNHGNNSNVIKYVFAKEDQNIPLWIVEGKADIGVLSNIDLEHQTFKSY